jgi:tryptophan 6-halogenase
MKGKLPASIVIVGGGTAGWITASVLSRNWGDNGPSITLVESPQVATVGVGESSIPPLRTLLSIIGVDEQDWMRHTNATFKTALKLSNWGGPSSRRDYYHPLFCWGENESEFFDDWLHAHRFEGFDEPFDACFYGSHLAAASKAPKQGTEAPNAGRMQYAYHLDAALCADYLSGWCRDRGVRHILDHVDGVSLDEKGGVESVHTKSNGDLRGELFFDCTGFRGLIINKALGEPFESFSDTLYCDSAIAISTFPEPGEGRLESTTTATALSAGWSWDIPLQNRHGTGYVFSSSELEPDQAEGELRAHLGEDVEQGDANLIKMRVGRCRRAWVGNCISVGLSTGFIEPLESTSIFCIQAGVVEYLRCLGACETEQAQRDTYNKRVNDLFEGIRDFVLAHYHLSGRDDSEFWRAYRNHSNLPESLQAILERWDADGDISDVLRNHPSTAIVGMTSWLCIFAGLDRLPRAGKYSAGSRTAKPKLAQRVAELAADAKTYSDHFSYFNS